MSVFIYSRALESFHVLKFIVCTSQRCSILVSSVCIDACDERDNKSRKKKRKRVERLVDVWQFMCKKDKRVSENIGMWW